jgi:hypothetical protein
MAVTSERSSLGAVSTLGTVSEVRSSFWMGTGCCEETGGQGSGYS